MRKKQILGFALALIFAASINALYAQEKKQDEPAQEKKQDQPAKEVEIVEPVKVEPKPAPKGKEPIMIYSGEYFKVQLYGFIKADFVFNTVDFHHDSSPLGIIDQYAYWSMNDIPGITIPAVYRPYFVVPYKKTASQRDGGFFADARSTRLGLKLTGPEVLRAKTSAVIEADFWGQMPNSGTANRQGMLRMRHAMVKLEWPIGTSIMGGQYWSAAMPGVTADMVAFIPFGAMGLVFMRETQLTLAQKINIHKMLSINIEASMARVQSGDDPGAGFLYPGSRNSQVDQIGPGEASKIPGARGRVTVDFKPHDLVALKLGCATHFQVERHALTFTRWQTAGFITAAQLALITQKYSRKVNSFSVSPFASINVHLFTLVGSMFIGANMDTFLLGLGQGVVESFEHTKISAVRTMGGWIQAQFDLRKIGPIPLKLCAGYGTEVKKNRNLYTPGTQLWIRTVEGNLWWYLNDYLSVGAEAQYIVGKFKGAPNSDGMKYQMAVNFAF